MVGTLGYALAKAFAVDFEELIDETTGKARTPSSLELLQRRVKGLEWEEARCQGRRKRKAHAENYRKAIEAYRKQFFYLNKKKRWIKRRIQGIERVVEDIHQKLKKNPTNTYLMKKFKYYLNELYRLQKLHEYLVSELRKFVKFLKEFKKLHPIAFQLWEDVGETKGKPPRRYAQPEEYSDINGFSIHYLREYY